MNFLTQESNYLLLSSDKTETQKVMEILEDTKRFLEEHGFKVEIIPTEDTTSFIVNLCNIEILNFSFKMAFLTDSYEIVPALKLHNRLVSNIVDTLIVIREAAVYSELLAEAKVHTDIDGIINTIYSNEEDLHSSINYQLTVDSIRAMESGQLSERRNSTRSQSFLAMLNVIEGACFKIDSLMTQYMRKYRESQESIEPVKWES